MKWIFSLSIFSFFFWNPFCVAVPVELVRDQDLKNRIENLIKLNVIELSSQYDQVNKSNAMSVTIEGKFTDGNWSILLGDNVDAIETNDLGEFSFLTSIQGIDTQLELTVIDSNGLTYKETITLNFPEYEQYKNDPPAYWRLNPLRFELLSSLFYVSKQSYFLGGTFAFAPKIQTKIQWLAFFPRLSCGFSKDIAGEFFPLAAIGIDGVVLPKRWPFIIAAGGGYGVAFEKIKASSYPEISGTLGYPLEFGRSSFLNHFETLFLRYDRLFSPVPIHVVSVGLSLTWDQVK
jgi:hypothetical protein